jgi:Domain of unknown function (DUF3425)
MSANKSTSFTARSSSLQSKAPSSAVDEEDRQENELSFDDFTDASLTSPIDVHTQPSELRSKRTRPKGRKSNISSACLECKKRRRKVCGNPLAEVHTSLTSLSKCTGETPCQTCTDLKTECVYDPTMDRRSKAYFQKRLAESAAAGFVQSEKSQDELISMLRDNKTLDFDVATEVQRALQLREHSATFSTPRPSNVDITQDPATVNTQAERTICTVFCRLAATGSPAAVWYSDLFRQQQELRLQGPHHLIIPHVIPDRSPLSLIFINFKNGVSNMLAQGTPLAQVLGPLDPTIDLMFRPRLPTDPFSASTWACELARIDIAVDIVTQLANAFLLSRFMRWHVMPSLESYLLLPEIMRPTSAQKTIPHFASADLYAIPAVRDCLIQGNFDLLETIGTPGTQGIKFHWPFDMEKAIDIDPTTGAQVLSRLFGVCASELSNWSCSKDILINSPMTKGLLNVIDHQHKWDELAATAFAS